MTLAAAARTILPHLFPPNLPGVRYARLGVVLLDLETKDTQPTLDLFRPAGERAGLGTLLDEVNAKLGLGSLGIGLGGYATPPDWQMKRELLSRRATTHWGELAIARA